MHLPELPTIFVKGGEERKVYFTVQARELLAAGWVVKGEEQKKAAPEKQEAEPVKEVKPRAVKAKTEAKVNKEEEIAIDE